MKKQTLIWLGLITLFGFSGLGWFIIFLTADQSIANLFFSGWHWAYQLLSGLLYGSFSALIAWRIIRSHVLSDVRNFYTELINRMQMNSAEILFVSFCAGIGEELLFRGALQPLAQAYSSWHYGIWITSVVFVAIHGYLNPANLKLALYGIYMTAVIAGMGYLSCITGIITAMSAHFIIDVMLLFFINRKEDGDPSPTFSI